jgi:zinc finger protein
MATLDPAAPDMKKQEKEQEPVVKDLGQTIDDDDTGRFVCVFCACACRFVMLLSIRVVGLGGGGAAAAQVRPDRIASPALHGINSEVRTPNRVSRPTWLPPTPQSTRHTPPPPPPPGIMEIPQSLCMACGESGLTRMILTKIPFFREVIISSFECDSCGWTNNEVQFGGAIQEQGCRYELKVTEAADLNRQVIKSDNGAIFIPELELEIPAKTQRGSVNTIEGVLQATVEGLQAEQDFRREHAPEVAAQVDEYLARLALYKTGITLPFTFVVDDPAGNSFVENPLAPRPDPRLRVTQYERTAAQDLEVGLQPSDAAKAAGRLDEGMGKAPAPHVFDGIDRLMAAGRKHEGPEEGGNGEEGKEGGGGGLGRSEAIVFQQDCPNCHRPGEAVNCVTDIPYFKEVLIMAFTCAECGYRNNEIKGGGAIPAEGTVVRLRVEGKEDFSRDVLKSDTAGVTIPELDLEITQGSLGGFFSSVEGLLEKIRVHLKEGNPFGTGDSAVKHHLGERDGEEKKEKEKRDGDGEGDGLQERFRSFMAQLDEYVEGKVLPFTIELRDPLGNSFIAFRGLSPEADGALTTESYQRSWDEDEHLGLHDMATEGYETGYDAAHYQERLQPELKRNPHTHGGDHPTPFARGCEAADTTPGAMQGRATTTTAAGAEAAGTPAAVPFDVEKEEEEDAGFEPAGGFEGAKEGRVFKLGNKGLGYYTDRRI